MAAGKAKKAKKGNTDSKAVAKAAKKNKAAAKQEKRETKQIKKTKSKGKGKDGGNGQDQDMDEADLIRTLEEYRQKWAEEHKVSGTWNVSLEPGEVLEAYLCTGSTEETVEGPPSRRANATFTPCPVKDHLYLFGGEYFDGQKVELYADMYRYAPDKNEWRKFTSPTAPGPRSAHQMVASPAGGGKLWLFGGEFSAPNQSSFHHYRDLWCFDIATHTWDRFDTKLRPSARSGHRMCMWKHLMFLFGGFQDTGIRTSYLADLWVWDTQNYRWHQIEFGELERKPAARSGSSLLPCADGVVLHGGYCKIYDGKRSTGIGQALEDTWLLRIPPANEEGVIDFKKCKWEKRKKVGYAPSLRSGCTMALWQAKNMGVLFGGVSDEDKDEETLEFGYNLAGTGRWISLPLKKKKKQGGGGAKKKKKAKAAAAAVAAAEAAAKREANDTDNDMSGTGEDEDRSDDEADSGDDGGPKPWEIAKLKKEAAQLAEENGGDGQISTMAGDEDDDDPDDPQKTVPMSRYNAMLAVQRNTLYIYGGILESGDREWTLDDFHTIALDKLDRFTCLRECVIDNEWLGSDSEDDDDDDSSDEEEDGEKSDSQDEDEGDYETSERAVDEDFVMNMVPVAELKLSDAEQAALDAKRAQAEKEDLRRRATAFAGVSTSASRTAEDIFSTPQPGETLAQFFERSKEYFTQKAHEHQPAHRGKELRRDGFELAKEAYEKYLPLLEELIRIQEEAGLDADEAKAGQRAGLGTDSRNRR
ncbi:Kelch repeat-containing protein 3 [Microbotryomycetes sp. JL201]|nr:Kelch repeat-containing protein 3 [Microbotryomycetes sp. JL201]